tara:strand:+ start:448 stop:744 length:297 start_codon:yes stop_codon:yes gene_type:complete
MYYNQELNKTVQWNTHELSGGVPVFGFNTKQIYAPEALDNVLDQGGFDNINPNVFRGARTQGQLNYKLGQPMRTVFEQSYHAPRNNNTWEYNINWSNS